jgi:flagellar biosynthesis GTPase FlhF
MNRTLTDTESRQGSSPPPAAAPPTAAADGSRTYRGRSFAELVPQIEAELGADAIVLSRRSGLAGGVAGFFQTPFVEVQARAGHPGIDLLDGAPAAPEAVREQFPELGAATVTARYDSARLSAAPASAPAAPHESDAFAAALARAASVDGGDAVADTQLEEDGGALDPSAVAADPAPSEEPEVVFPAERPLANELAAAATPAHGRARAALEAKLRARGVEQVLIDELIESAIAHELPLMPNRTPLAAAVKAVLRRRIPGAPPLPAQGTTLALVGPGGAGKTSCCAALLRAHALRGGAQAACATIADGQGQPALLLWPELATPTALGDARAGRALARARACGLLLVDTPSLSPGEPGSVRALAGLLRRLEVDRVVLALPATWGAAAAAQLLEAAKPLGASSLAITHADATDQLGVAVQAACRFGLAPEFLFERRRGGSLSRTDPCDLVERLLA